MPDIRKRKHDYRKVLTSNEAQELDEIEREAREIDARRRELSDRRRAIAGRAIKRLTARPA